MKSSLCKLYWFFSSTRRGSSALGLNSVSSSDEQCWSFLWGVCGWMERQEGSEELAWVQIILAAHHWSVIGSLIWRLWAVCVERWTIVYWWSIERGQLSDFLYLVLLLKWFTWPLNVTRIRQAVVRHLYVYHFYIQNFSYKLYILHLHFTFTFMHLAEAFIQSDLQLHSGYTFFNQYVILQCRHFTFFYCITL